MLLLKLSVGGPKLTLSSFKLLKDYVHWLGGIRRGTTWDAELEAMLVEVDAKGANKGILREHEGEDGVAGVADLGVGTDKLHHDNLLLSNNDVLL